MEGKEDIIKGNKLMESIIENIKARFKAKPFCIWKESVVEKGNDGYYLYNGIIYYGDRFFVFFVSNQNSWYQLYKKQ